LIKEFKQCEPDVPQVACFDTGFHQTMPDVARRLAIPGVYDARGVRRYGFHGLSYAYLIEELRRVAGDAAADGPVIIAQRGNGSRVTGIREDRGAATK